jgi:hypothetical protein
MTDLRDRLHGVDEVPVRDAWPEIEGRARRSAHRSIVGRWTTIAAALGIGLIGVAVAFLAFKGSRVQVPAASTDGAQITITQTDPGDLSATWDVGEQVREGVPVRTILPQGMGDGTVRGEFADIMGVKSFSIDTTDLWALHLDPISTPNDVTVVSTPDPLILFLFGQANDEEVMTPLFTPADLRELDPETYRPGTYRVVVVGRASDTSLFQFAFEIELTSASSTSPQPGTEPVPRFTAEDFVDGTAPLGDDLASALGLASWDAFQGDCSYYVEVDGTAGYCLEDVSGSKIDLAAIASGLQGHRIDQEDLENIERSLAQASDGASPP